MIVRVSNNSGEGPAQSPGTFVRNLLAALGETQASASRKTDISSAILGRWMRDEMEPGIKNARKFADGLGVPRLFVLFGLQILEPKDVNFDLAFTRLMEVYALIQSKPERERVREQIDFIASMASKKLLGGQHPEDLGEDKRGVG